MFETPVSAASFCDPVPSQRNKYSSAILFLNRVERALERGDVALPFDTLLCSLQQLRSRWSEPAWKHFCVAVCREHAINDVLREDPFTRRCLERPRGYAGDAVMLDYIYSGLSPDERRRTTDRGAAIFRKTAYAAPYGEAVRARKDLIARSIDETADRVPNARVLSVACGHLREALESSALQEGRIRELVGVDQDPASLEVVARDLSRFPVTTMAASVRDILSGRTHLDGFDFAYTAGLIDYLDDGTTFRLMTTLISALKPRGRLLVANFIPDFEGSAYMEAFMDWRLKCRSRADLRDLADALPIEMLSGRRTFVDEQGSVAYLELTRR